MQGTHDLLVDKAKAAINDVFSDTSVPPETTAASLRDLRDEIEIMLDTLPD